MTRAFDRDGDDRPVLVCLDLQRASGDEARSWVEPERAEAGARLLAHARCRGWSIVHVYRDWRAGRGSAAKPLPGFEPRPSEPVFLRRGVSAFTSRRFAETLSCAVNGEVIVAGADLGASGLATVLDAHDRGLSVTLVEDAFGASPIGGVEPGVLEQVLWKLVAPFARLSRVDAVLARRPEGAERFDNDDWSSIGDQR